MENDQRPLLTDLVPALASGDFPGAIAGMRDWPFLKTERFQLLKGRVDPSNGEPEIVKFYQALIKRLAAVGIPIYCHCLHRGAMEQNRLFKEGRSKAKAGQSAHNYGAAVDMVHALKHWDLTRKQWEVIGHAGKETAKALNIKVVWGGDWKFYDPAHWELENWREIRGRYRDGEEYDARKSK